MLVLSSSFLPSSFVGAFISTCSPLHDLVCFPCLRAGESFLCLYSILISVIRLVSPCQIRCCDFSLAIGRLFVLQVMGFRCEGVVLDLWGVLRLASGMDLLECMMSISRDCTAMSNDQCSHWALPRRPPGWSIGAAWVYLPWVPFSFFVLCSMLPKVLWIYFFQFCFFALLVCVLCYIVLGLYLSLTLCSFRFRRCLNICVGADGVDSVDVLSTLSVLLLLVQIDFSFQFGLAFLVWFIFIWFSFEFKFGLL